MRGGVFRGCYISAVSGWGGRHQFSCRGPVSPCSGVGDLSSLVTSPVYEVAVTTMRGKLLIDGLVNFVSINWTVRILTVRWSDKPFWVAKFTWK